MDIKKLEGRKWLITINNPEDKGIEFEDVKNLLENKYKNIVYYCYCKEIGLKEHTPHIHIFLYVKHSIKATSILKLFNGAHIDLCSGTCQENRDYIYKTGKYEGSPKEDTRIEGMQCESGECPTERPGKRTDLDELKNLVKEGKTNAQIYEINPQFLRYANTIDKIRFDILSEKFGSQWRNVEVTYIEGVTGTGKTRGIMESFGYTNVCRIKKDDYGFNAYTAQDVVIFEEFRNTFKLEDMLDFLDGYPSEGRALYGKRQLGFTKAFICSNWRLDEQYRNIQEEHPRDWQAFLRRINKVIVRTFEGDTVFYQKNRGTEYDPQFDFISDEGLSYFDPFDLQKWGADEVGEWQVTENFSWDDLP